MEHLREQPARQVYQLTHRGRAQLETRTEAWRKLATTIGRVLEAN